MLREKNNGTPPLGKKLQENRKKVGGEKGSRNNDRNIRKLFSGKSSMGYGSSKKIEVYSNVEHEEGREMGRVGGEEANRRDRN